MKESTCRVPECGKLAKNYFKFCPSHQYRNWRYGSPYGAAHAPLEERFWANVRKSEGCWEWVGALAKSGYGQISANGKNTFVHRLSYEWAGGQIPDGFMIDHVCRNRVCVNPEHLRLATSKQNAENLSLRKTNTSGARGVGWDARRGRWIARVTHNQRGYYGGSYTTFEEADEAAKALRRKLFTHSIETGDA